MPFGSFLVQRGANPRVIILIGEAVALTCFILATQMQTFATFTLFYVLGFGMQNFVYMVPIHHGWLWFPGHPGLVSGIIIGGYGFGAFIFDNVATHVINPDNLPIDTDTGLYPTSVNDNFKKMMYTLIGSWFAITLIGLITIFPGPGHKSDKSANSDHSDLKSDPSATDTDKK